MNKRSRIVLIVFLTVVLMTAVAIPAQAKKDTNFHVYYRLWQDGTPENPGDPYTVVGDYTMTYCEETLGWGDVYHTWIPRLEVLQGTMVLTDDVDGSVMVIRTTMGRIESTEDGDVTVTDGFGTYQILDRLHVGDKYALVGNGTLDMHRVCSGPEDARVCETDGNLVGWADPWHWD